MEITELTHQGKLLLKFQTKVIRKAIGKQLGYVGRNLRTVDHLLRLEGRGVLSRRQTKELETIRTHYQLC